MTSTNGHQLDLPGPAGDRPPYHWTDDGRLETDPHGIPPVSVDDQPDADVSSQHHAQKLAGQARAGVIVHVTRARTELDLLRRGRTWPDIQRSEWLACADLRENGDPQGEPLPGIKLGKEIQRRKLALRAADTGHETKIPLPDIDTPPRWTPPAMIGGATSIVAALYDALPPEWAVDGLVGTAGAVALVLGAGAHWWWLHTAGIAVADRRAELEELRADGDQVEGLHNTQGHPVRGGATAELDDDQVVTSILRSARTITAQQSVMVRANRSNDVRTVYDVTLPDGVPHATINRMRLAAAWSAHRTQITIQPGGPENECTLIRYRQIPFMGAPVVSPLLSGGTVDLVRNGFCMGADVDGHTVVVNLERGVHGLIIGAAGSGKSSHARNLLLAAVIDPRAEIGGLFDGKSSRDLDVFRGFCDWYIDPVVTGRSWWSKLADRLEREVQIAEDRQQRIAAGEDLGYRFIALDEFQKALGRPGDRGKLDKGKKDEAWSDAARCCHAVEELSRMGRSARVRLVLISQSYNGDVLPAAVEANVLWRIVGWIASTVMDPRTTLGDVADLGITPDTVLTRDQVGAAIVISPGISDYAVARGWFQDGATLADAVTGAGRREQRVIDDGEHAELFAALESVLDGHDEPEIRSSVLQADANPRDLRGQDYVGLLVSLGAQRFDTGSTGLDGKKRRAATFDVQSIRWAIMRHRSA